MSPCLPAGQTGRSRSRGRMLGGGRIDFILMWGGKHLPQSRTGCGADGPGRRAVGVRQGMCGPDISWSKHRSARYKGGEEGGIQLQRRAAHFIQVLLPATFCNDEGGGGVSFRTVCHGIKNEIVQGEPSRANYDAKQMLWRDAPRICSDTAAPRLWCLK